MMDGEAVRAHLPLNLSCRHCSEGGGVCVVDPETVVCRHRMGRRTGESTLQR